MNPRQTTSLSVQSSSAASRPRYATWRAATLALVYILFVAHIVHWKLAGRTLAPLELNEVMYTLELGVVTAGFIFMSIVCVVTLIFGRFFCSWGCHILALQDLCAWLLGKLRIRPRPVRSRMLLLVPPLAAFYMFVWPQINRLIHGQPLPQLHLRSDAQGWASFVTTDFWRNLPGPWITGLTFAVCGFLVVYVLGSRSFCTYGCPYGALFGLLDRFSPGRIRLVGDCRQCATCTAACTSHIRVHEEVASFGKIVNPACMKDLDCVAACPQGALAYGFTTPAPLASLRRRGRFGVPYDFSLGEDVLMAGMFVFSLLALRGLYGQVPFLMTLGLGGILGYVLILTWRLLRRRDVRLAPLQLKRVGRLTAAGWIFQSFAFLLFLLLAHSAFIRYHEYRGLNLASVARSSPDPVQQPLLAAQACNHLRLADHWGLFDNPVLERSMMAAALQSGDFAASEFYAGRVIRRFGHDPQTSMTLATLDARQGNFAAAEEHLRSGLTASFNDPALHAELGAVLAEQGRLEEAIASLQEAVKLNPHLPEASYNLGTMLSHLGRFDEALPHLQRALQHLPEDAELHNNLGFALIRLGDLDQARIHLERAVSLAPDNPDAHFNLAGLLAHQGQHDQAAAHYRRAAELSPLYADFLRSAPAP